MVLANVAISAKVKMTPNDSKITRSEQREAARAKARDMREARKKADRRNRVVVRGGIAALILGVVAGIAIVIVNLTSTPVVTPSDKVYYPANMTWDNGIRIGAGLKVINRDEPSATPTAAATPGTTNVPNITVYLDYQCPVCGMFEKAQSEQIKAWVTKGAATVEIHPVAFLDGYLDAFGTDFSKNSANAAVCVADQAPNSFFNFNNLMYTNQQAEGTAGPTDDQLIGWAKDAGVGSASSSVENCIKTKRFVPWVLFEATKYLKDRKDTSSHWFEQIPGMPVDSIPSDQRGTPFVLVNGALVNPRAAIFDAAGFAQVVLRASTTTK